MHVFINNEFFESNKKQQVFYMKRIYLTQKLYTIKIESAEELINYLINRKLYKVSE